MTEVALVLVAFSTLMNSIALLSILMYLKSGNKNADNGSNDGDNRIMENQEGR